MSRCMMKKRSCPSSDMHPPRKIYRMMAGASVPPPPRRNSPSLPPRRNSPSPPPRRNSPSQERISVILKNSAYFKRQSKTYYRYDINTKIYYYNDPETKFQYQYDPQTKDHYYYDPITKHQYLYDLTTSNYRKVSSAASRVTIQHQASSIAPQVDTNNNNTNSNKCIVCEDNDYNCVLNCGHLVMCTECADQVDQCPMCRDPITKRKKIFKR